MSHVTIKQTKPPTHLDYSHVDEEASLAIKRGLPLNIRIANPPPRQDCPPAAGSSYMFHLKSGDELTAIGSFGDFHIKPTKKEMVCIGGPRKGDAVTRRRASSPNSVPRPINNCFLTRKPRSPIWRTSATGWPAAKNHVSTRTHQ